MICGFFLIFWSLSCYICLRCCHLLQEQTSDLKRKENSASLQFKSRSPRQQEDSIQDIQEQESSLYPLVFSSRDHHMGFLHTLNVDLARVDREPHLGDEPVKHPTWDPSYLLKSSWSSFMQYEESIPVPWQEDFWIYQLR